MNLQNFPLPSQNQTSSMWNGRKHSQKLTIFHILRNDEHGPLSYHCIEPHQACMAQFLHQVGFSQEGFRWHAALFQTLDGNFCMAIIVACGRREGKYGSRAKPEFPIAGHKSTVEGEDLLVIKTASPPFWSSSRPVCGGKGSGRSWWRPGPHNWSHAFFFMYHVVHVKTE